MSLIVAARELQEDLIDWSRARMLGLPRRTRWAITLAVATVPGVVLWAVAASMYDDARRDALIVQTQRTQQALVVAEDAEWCRAEVRLNGESVVAEDSCGETSYEPGSTVWLARDPADPHRYLIAGPDQEWAVAPGEAIVPPAVGLGSGVLLLGLFSFGLLRHDPPRVPVAEVPAEGREPKRSRRVWSEGFWDGIETRWDAGKDRLATAGLRLRAADRRIRWPLMAACCAAIAVFVGGMALEAKARGEHDRAVVAAGPVVEATLIRHAEGGEDGINETVRLEGKRLELAHPLVHAGEYDVGDALLVVRDPQDPSRVLAEPPGRKRPTIVQDLLE